MTMMLLRLHTLWNRNDHDVIPLTAMQGVNHKNPTHTVWMGLKFYCIAGKAQCVTLYPNQYAPPQGLTNMCY